MGRFAIKRARDLAVDDEWIVCFFSRRDCEKWIQDGRYAFDREADRWVEGEPVTSRHDPEIAAKFTAADSPWWVVTHRDASRGAA